MSEFEVVYFETVNNRWVFAARFDTRAQADEKANEIRTAGYDARVSEVVIDWEDDVFDDEYVAPEED